MKNLSVLLLAAFIQVSAFAQSDNAYTFEIVKSQDATETKDQCKTGTCWSFATISFVESELIRMGKGQHNLSEMFNVRMTYPKKAEQYVRYQGKYQFGPGSLCHDVINVIRDHGVIPEQVYDGLNYGTDRHDHGEMDAMLEGMVKNLVEKARGNLSPNWMEAVEAVLDGYLGEVPSEFQYNGKSYSPESLRDELGLVADDYVSISSFTHHPFYEDFVLEVPDNFSKQAFYNVPVEELYAICTDARDADVSEKGFSFSNGMAIAPVSGTKKAELFKTVVEEVDVTQELRQEGFDTYHTTDDHLMHITGISKDQDGNMYYVTKNSWGTGNSNDGYQHVSESYFKLKTIAIMVHKDAIPKDLQKKLGIS
jgi:bleomycin hydrolase